MRDSEGLLRAQIAEIRPLDREAMSAARAYQQMLAMPPGSMGRLQQLAVQLAGITGTVKTRIQKKRITVACADNGVVAEGVASAPQSVTFVQAVNMTKALTGMSCLANYFQCEVQVVDVGMSQEHGEPHILNCAIRRGTADIARGPAMTRGEAVAAIQAGMELARQAKEEGVDALGVGEMGIGNTTTSTAVLAALTGTSPDAITGRGGGITDAAFSRKKQVIAQALAVNAPRRDDVLDVLRCVGGLDIAAMCGTFLGAALHRLPVVIDGFISIVAALCASRLAPAAAEFFVPSHLSEEPGYRLAAKELGLEPFLHLGMRLGEGSGCPLAFSVLEASCVMMNDMATFAEAQIDDGYLQEVRREAAQ